MILITVCMDCKDVLRAGECVVPLVTPTPGQTFQLSHGLCDDCKEKRLAELRGQSVETIDLPFPADRCVCAFCNVELRDKQGLFRGLTIHTTNGLALLTCEACSEPHGERVLHFMSTVIAGYQYERKQTETVKGN